MLVGLMARHKAVDALSLEHFEHFEDCLELLLSKGPSELILLKCLNDMSHENTQTLAARVAELLLAHGVNPDRQITQEFSEKQTLPAPILTGVGP